MSWYREIKLLYTLFMNTLLLIMWSVIYYILSRQVIKELTILTFFISALIVIILNEKFFINKRENIRKAFISLITYLILAPLIYLTCKFNTKALIGNEFFLLLIIIETYKLEYEPIMHSIYKEKVKNGFIIFLIFGVLTNFLNENLSIMMFRFYIVLLVSAVLLLRESRNYEFKIRDNKSNVYNICFLIFVVFISIPKVYNLIFNGLRFVLKLLYNVYELLMEKILQFLYILFKPLEPLIEKLFKISISKETTTNNNEVIKTKNFYKNIKLSNQKSNMNFNIVYFIFWTCIIIVVLFILWKVYSSINANSSRDKEINYDEEVEKLIIKKNKGKSFKFIKDIFENLSVKDKILNTYKIFQKNSKKRGIYKKYMTATQLSNVSKIHIDGVEDLDSMATVYNEVKFSNHDVTKEHLDKIKKSYNNIKDQMK